MLSIKDKNGNEYKFEDHPIYDIELHGIRNNRIIGSYISTSVALFSINFEGYSRDFTFNPIKLTPYDKFKELKKAHSEGAKIEFYSTIDMKWLDTDNNKPGWYKYTNYRIKDNISIESWEVHKNLIKQWWDGAEIESLTGSWSVDTPNWYTNCPYRVKVKEMTLIEINEALGYNVKITK